MHNRISYASCLSLISTAILILFTPICRAQYAATPVTESITIDGRLSEPAWQQAEVFGDFLFLPSRTKGFPTAQTSFRILVDENAVFIGVRCEEPRMSELAAAPLQRDTDLFSQDCIEIFMDPTGTGDTYYQFVVSVNNDQWDGGWIEGGNAGMEDYSTVWKSAVYKGADFWSLEVRIPLSAFYNTRADNFIDTWKLNVARQRKSVYELTSWSPLLFNFHESANWRRVRGMPRKSPSADMAVLAVQAIIRSSDKTGCRGSAKIETFASEQAAGTYTVVISADGVPIITNAMVHVAAGDAEHVVDDLLFPTEGGISLQLEFFRPDGTPALGVICSARIRYRPFVFTLDEPFYAACIFDGQDVPEIRGSLEAHLPAGVLNGGVTLTFTGPGIAEPVTQTMIFKNGRAPFGFDATHLQVGQATLSAKAMQEGRMLTEGEQVIRKLPPNTDGSTVIIDRDLNLVANGRPLLYRGWYGGGEWMVSHVHQQRWPTENDAFPATDMGKNIDLQPERIDPSDVANVQSDVRPSQKIMDAIRERVIAGRSDPDLWWYYLSDEPECRYVSPVYLKHAYDLIKELDPYHPVVIISRAPRLYTECADILCPHPYVSPVIINGQRTLGQNMKVIRRQIRTVMDAGQGKILPWLCPQTFSYAFYHQDGADYPTLDESRCTIWSAIANGCKGFHPFIYHTALDAPDLLYGYRMFYESLARLEPIIISPSKPESVKIEAPEDGVDVMIKKEGDRLLIVAANLLDKPCVAIVRSPALKEIVQLDRFRESGVVTVDNSTIELTFEPYGVAILTHPALDEGLESLETVRARIAAANAARIRPGNVLYGRDLDIEASSSSTYISAKGIIHTLTDGLRDNIGWRHLNGVHPPWVELAFPVFVPHIRTLKVFGNRLQGMTVDYWEHEAWQLLGTAPDDAVNEATFSLDKPVTSTKLRFTLPNSKSGHIDAGELYEVEIYE